MRSGEERKSKSDTAKSSSDHGVRSDGASTDTSRGGTKYGIGEYDEQSWAEKGDEENVSNDCYN
jgi:hypothetical protein